MPSLCLFEIYDLKFQIPFLFGLHTPLHPTETAEPWSLLSTLFISSHQTSLAFLQRSFDYYCNNVFNISFSFALTPYFTPTF